MNKSSKNISRLLPLSLALTTIPVSAYAVEPSLNLPLNYVTTKMQLFREFWHSRIDSTFGNHGSPVSTADGQYIITGTASGKIVCLDKSGRKIWKLTDSHAIGTIGIIRNFSINGQKRDVFIAGALDGYVLAIDVSNGKELWSVNTKGGAILAQPYFELEDNKPVIYVATDQCKFFKLSALTGEKLWSYTHTPAVQEMTVRGHMPIFSKPEYDNVYVGTSDGYLLSFSKKAGLLSFKAMLAKKETTNRFTDVDAIPAIGGTKESPIIYAASFNGGLFAINGLNGNILWNHDEYMVSGIVNTGKGLVIIEPTGKVRGLDFQGFTKWETDFQSSQTGEPLFIASEKVVLVPVAADGILVIDAESGQPYQSLDIGGEFSAHLTLADDQLYFMTTQGTLYSFSVIY